MTDNLPEPVRRWHDNRGDLSAVVELLESIPLEIRPNLAEALTSKANQQFQAAEILKSLKSIGRDKILALHQARRKRRAYDQDSHLYEIVNTFFILPEDAQESLARDFLEFTELVVEYMANCDSFEITPNPDELVRMRDLFVASGAESVRSYLEQIHKPYYDRIASEGSVAEAIDLPSKNTLIQGEAGLRIKEPPID